MFEISIYRFDAIGFRFTYFFTKTLICSILKKKKSRLKKLLRGFFVANIGIYLGYR